MSSGWAAAAKAIARTEPLVGWGPSWARVTGPHRLENVLRVRGASPTPSTRAAGTAASDPRSTSSSTLTHNHRRPLATDACFAFPRSRRGFLVDGRSSSPQAESRIAPVRGPGEAATVEGTIERSRFHHPPPGREVRIDLRCGPSGPMSVEDPLDSVRHCAGRQHGEVVDDRCTVGRQPGRELAGGELEVGQLGPHVGQAADAAVVRQTAGGPARHGPVIDRDPAGTLGDRVVRTGQPREQLGLR